MQQLVHSHFGIGENKNTIQLPTAENFLIFKPLNPVESQAEIIWQKCVRHSSALKGKYIVQIRTDSVSTEIVNSNGARQDRKCWRFKEYMCPDDVRPVKEGKNLKQQTKMYWKFK